VPLLALLALAVVGGVLALTLLGGDDNGKGDGSSGTSAAERQQRAERRRARRQKAAQQREQSQQQPATPAAPAPAPDTGSSGGSGSDYEIPQPSGDDAAKASQLQVEGDRMIDSDPKGAVKLLEKSVKAFPAGTDDIHLQYAYFSLGKALRLSGRPDDAIPVLELRLKNPDQKATVQAELDKARKEAAG
jgi:hypothetical protein